MSGSTARLYGITMHHTRTHTSSIRTVRGHTRAKREGDVITEHTDGTRTHASMADDPQAHPTRHRSNAMGAAG
eukprot:4308275-Prymnesium_polylepis.1